VTTSGSEGLIDGDFDVDTEGLSDGYLSESKYEKDRS